MNPLINSLMVRAATGRRFEELSAVNAGVKDVRAVVEGYPWMSPLTLTATSFDRSTTPTHTSTRQSWNTSSRDNCLDRTGRVSLDFRPQMLVH